METARLRAEDGRHVDLVRWSSGAIGIEVQDLRPPEPLGNEYEYSFTVLADDVPAMVAALGGDAAPAASRSPEKAFALLRLRADELIDYRDGTGSSDSVSGEFDNGPGGWLDHHDVPYEFWSHSSWS